ncbi:MAG TPA: hypothetical protein VFQ93_14155 [Casimicrobiaceae bacterium]|jgi:hypothetical protein|nr:hypothetical protein [Casimicrobiaceae bacterium]
MNRQRLAAAISAMTVVLALPAIAYGNGQRDATAAVTDRVAEAQSDESMKNNPATNDTDRAGPAQDRDTSVGKKHPPTAGMDRATPPDKSPPNAALNKHPPTGAMDRAAPDEKSRGTPEGSSSDDASTHGSKQ